MAGLAACTVGKDGTPGAAGSPGVPCTGCVTAASLAPGAVTAAAIQDGASKTPQLGAGAVTGAKIANATIAGANIDPTTTLSASNFTYSNPVVGTFYADSTSCQRQSNVNGFATPMPPYQDVGTFHPQQNIFGPSILITNSAVAKNSFYCPINLQPPPGATVTVTSASMISGDFDTTCLIGAELRIKGVGTAVSAAAGAALGRVRGRGAAAGVSREDLAGWRGGGRGAAVRRPGPGAAPGANGGDAGDKKKKYIVCVYSDGDALERLASL